VYVLAAKITLTCNVKLLTAKQSNKNCNIAILKFEQYMPLYIG